jgi:GNAT superfamily N-acetyltransferase
VSAAAVARCVARGELAAAYEDGRPVGCVRVSRVDAVTGELGLLATARGAIGRGVGRALVRFAEETARARGARVMRLELLVPRHAAHPAKAWLHEWYSRLGYRVIGREDFATAYAEVGPWLAVPCDLVSYEKALGGPGELLAG